MSKLSAYVLTFNEEGKVRDALHSLTWADEIVVLDSHSTDRTEQICRQYTDKVYQCDFAGFGKLRFRLDWISTDLDRLETPFASILGRRSRIKKAHRESFLTGVNAYFGLNGNPVPLISH